MGWYATALYSAHHWKIIISYLIAAFAALRTYALCPDIYRWLISASVFVLTSVPVVVILLVCDPTVAYSSIIQTITTTEGKSIWAWDHGWSFRRCRSNCWNITERAHEVSALFLHSLRYILTTIIVDVCGHFTTSLFGLQGLSFCMPVTILTRSCTIASDVVVLLVTWYRTHETVKLSFHDHPRQTFASILLIDGRYWN